MQDLFAYIYFSKVQKSIKNTFTIYINIKIVNIQYLLSQNESLKGKKKELKPVFILKSYNTTVFSKTSWTFPAILTNFKNIIFLSSCSCRDLRSDHVSLQQPNRRLGVVVATVIHSRCGVRQHRRYEALGSLHARLM